MLDQLYTATESRTETPIADEEGLKAEVKEIQSTAVQKNEKVDEQMWLEAAVMAGVDARNALALPQSY